MIHFTIQGHDHSDKSFAITGPNGIVLNVDYDDVDHEEVDFTAKTLVNFLNDNWPAKWYDMRIKDMRRLEDIKFAKKDEGWAQH